MSRPPSNGPVLEASSVALAYHSWRFHRLPLRYDIPALSGVSLQVPEGGIVGIVGPNGSGKSTFLRIVLGLLKPDAGTLSVFGEKPGSQTARRLSGYAPEDPEFFSRLSGRDVLTLSGRLYGLRGRELSSRLDQTLDEVGLTAASRRRVSSYSKGMRRRLALGQAILHRPRLLLLDEPFEGLDPLGCLELHSRLRELVREGATVLMTSHRLSDIERLCDEVTVFHEGRVLLQGVTEEVLTVPEQWTLTLEGVSEQALDDFTSQVDKDGGRIVEKMRPRKSLEALFTSLVRDRGGTE